MASYSVDVIWERGDQPFLDNKYSRGHEIRLDGGITVPGSASPHVVPLPHSVEAAMDPEEAFVAALSNCHMLWFLDLARQAGSIVDRYLDRPVGVMERAGKGQYWISRVTLHPEITWDGPAPDADAIAALHHEAHERCFIANSVKTEVTVG